MEEKNSENKSWWMMECQAVVYRVDYYASCIDRHKYLLDLSIHVL